MLWSKWLLMMRTASAVGAALSAFVATRPCQNRCSFVHQATYIGIQAASRRSRRNICSRHILSRRQPATFLHTAVSRRLSTARNINDTTPSATISSSSSSSTSSSIRGTKLYVANISNETTKQRLKQYFEQYGHVVDVSLPMDRNEPTRHRGFAFVTFAEKDVAHSIVNANTSTEDTEQSLDGRDLLVSMAFPRGQRVPARFDDTSENEKTKRRTLFTIDDSVCPPTDADALRNVVTKHCKTLDRYLENAPIAAHTRAAFSEVKKYAEDFFPNGVIPHHHQSSTSEPGLILDSGCGTGRSTRLLGERHPQDLVIGVDRSLTRISKNMGHISSDGDSFVRTIEGQPNVLLVRAELSSFWRLLVDEGWAFRRQYILYPNPYPKPRRLKSRFYAHPIFPILLSVGSDVVVRSNWQGYLKEFATSARYASDCCADGSLCHIESVGPYPIVITDGASALTNFERKYYDCGESVYELLLIRAGTCSSLRE